MQPPHFNVLKWQPHVMPPKILELIYVYCANPAESRGVNKLERKEGNTSVTSFQENEKQRMQKIARSPPPPPPRRTGKK